MYMSNMINSTRITMWIERKRDLCIMDADVYVPAKQSNAPSLSNAHRRARLSHKYPGNKYA